MSAVDAERAAAAREVRALEGRKLAERLSLAIACSGQSARAVAKVAGLAGSSLTNTIRLLRSGAKTTMTVETIAAVARVCRVRAGWLAFGEGRQ